MFEVDLAIVSGSPQIGAALRPVGGAERTGWVEPARADYLANLRHDRCPVCTLQLGDVIPHLRERLPDDAVITNGAGNYTVRAHRFYDLDRYGTQPSPGRWATASRRRSW